MITGQTKNFGVIGHPIGHSLSPAMQNAGIQAAGLDCVYIAMPVEEEDLAQAVTGLKTLGFQGFIVRMFALCLQHAQNSLQGVAFCANII